MLRQALHEAPPSTPPVRHRVRDVGVGGTLLDYVSNRFDTVHRDRWRELMVEGRFGLAQSQTRIGPEHILALDDTLEVNFPAGMLQSTAMSQAPPDLAVLYHDDDLIVVDKAPNLLCYPQGLGTLAAKRYAQRWVAERDDRDLNALDDIALRPLHRLDKETSGVLMFAKNKEADRGIKIAFERRQVSKAYLAIVRGQLPLGETTVDAAVGPDVGGPIRVRQTVRADGKQAVTHLRATEHFGDDDWGSAGRGYTWVEVTPVSGRTHQIRLHLAHIGYPIVGDKLYTDDGAFFIRHRASIPTSNDLAALGMPRQALHAQRLEVAHPRTAEALVLIAPTPQDMTRFAADAASRSRLG